MCFLDPLLCALHNVVSDSFNFDLGAFELVVGPVDIWIESSEPRVSQDEVIFPYVSDIESLSEFLLSLFDKEVAIMGDFSILFMDPSTV